MPTNIEREGDMQKKKEEKAKRPKNEHKSRRKSQKDYS